MNSCSKDMPDFKKVGKTCLRYVCWNITPGGRLYIYLFDSHTTIDALASAFCLPHQMKENQLARRNMSNVNKRSTVPRDFFKIEYIHKISFDTRGCTGGCSPDHFAAQPPKAISASGAMRYALLL